LQASTAKNSTASTGNTRLVWIMAVLSSLYRRHYEKIT
jgi:hypothetical protein